MVEKGPLVDGVTGKPTVSVDGLPFDEYVQPLRRIKDTSGVLNDARSAKRHRGRRAAGGAVAANGTGRRRGWPAAYVQANLVVVPRDLAFDFLLFCQRNPKPCPLLDVTEPGSPEAALGGARRRRATPTPRATASTEHGELVDEPADLLVAVARRSGRLPARLLLHVRACAAGGGRAGAAHRTGPQRADVSHQHRLPAGGRLPRADGRVDAADDAGPGGRRPRASARASRGRTARRSTSAIRRRSASAISPGRTSATRWTCGRARRRCSGRAA